MQTGDTLKTIAYNQWGDSSLWYLIAEANGIAGDSDLAGMVGRLIDIPNQITNRHNNADTIRPYSASDIHGDTSPHMPTPLPSAHNKDGCGGLGMIVVAIVAIVVTIYTAGAAASALGAVTASGATGAGATGAAVFTGGLTAAGGASAGFGTYFAAAAVGSAAGSIVSQGVGIAIGVQDKFSWSAVASGAISAGISAGVTGVLGQAGLAKFVGDNATAQVMAGAAIQNAIGQGVAIAVGAQKRFDWRGVASSAIAAPLAKLASESIGKAVDQAVGNAFGGLAAQAAQRATSALTYQSVSLMLHKGGKLNAVGVIADAFGNVIGESLMGAASNFNGSNGAGTKDDQTGALIARNDAWRGTEAMSHAGDAAELTNELGNLKRNDELWPSVDNRYGAVVGSDADTANFNPMGYLTYSGNSHSTPEWDVSNFGQASDDIRVGAKRSAPDFSQVQSTLFNSSPLVTDLQETPAIGWIRGAESPVNFGQGVQIASAANIALPPFNAPGFSIANGLPTLIGGAVIDALGVIGGMLIPGNVGQGVRDQIRGPYAAPGYDGAPPTISGLTSYPAEVLTPTTITMSSGSDGRKTVVNSGGEAVDRQFVKDHDELLRAAEKAAGGSLDKFENTKPNWWQSPDGKRKIEWNPDGHANTNEGPHVTVRDFNGRRHEVTEKFFIEGREKFK